MKVWLLYLILMKAMLTCFSGPTSLPVVHHDLVEKYHVLSDKQLTTAVAAGRLTPGPFGLYLVSVGYFIDGTPGAIAGFLALITPAFLIIPMLFYLGHRVNKPRIRNAVRVLTLASAGLLLTTTIPLARVAIQGPLTIGIALGTFVLLVFLKRSTIWAIVGGAAAGMLFYLIA
ncbi:MAG TPA: chromate transporter [Candidatus Acidoferrales bacterium]|nr:chromate transporter [Candidatus Acidoferrales bacterium]